MFGRRATLSVSLAIGESGGVSVAAPTNRIQGTGSRSVLLEQINISPTEVLVPRMSQREVRSSTRTFPKSHIFFCWDTTTRE